jgi:hypothetical protein
MSLNWKTNKIENFQTVCFIGEGEERRLNPVTEALIWYTMSVDIGQLTDAILDEFYARMMIADRLYGPLYSETYIDGTTGQQRLRKRSLTYAELKAHVGLSTNATFKPVARSKWLKQKVDLISSDANWQTRKAKQECGE